ncbi:hypothetical protein EDD96_6644 [Streptomyces sp. Ag109_G2-6]|nr:hypothetical protein EDD96_6644 [Streptomyces sp. Ag109_G2-6]
MKLGAAQESLNLLGRSFPHAHQKIRNKGVDLKPVVPLGPTGVATRPLQHWLNPTGQPTPGLVALEANSVFLVSVLGRSRLLHHAHKTVNPPTQLFKLTPLNN